MANPPPKPKHYFECTAIDFDGENDAEIDSPEYTNRNPDFTTCANKMVTGLQAGVLGPLGTELGPNDLPILWCQWRSTMGKTTCIETP